MNIALHSAYGLFELLIAAFVGGTVSAFVFLLIRQMYLIPHVVTASRFLRYGRFMIGMRNAKPRKLFISVSDFSASLILAALLLCLTFVYNSGRFRLISLVFLIIGFALGVTVFSRPMLGLTVFLLFCVKWLADIALFPFTWIFIILKRIAKKTFCKLYNICYSIIAAKYTSYRISRIKKEARYGLLDDYYKEKIQ